MLVEHVFVPYVFFEFEKVRSRKKDGHILSIIHHHTIMADDLANNWGCNLVLTSTDRIRRDSIGGNSNCFKRLDEAVSKSTKGMFILTKACGCGSDANAIAISEAANCDTSRLAIAAGSYVAGDNSILQRLSTSCFDVQAALAVIQPPQDIAEEFTGQRTFALPYRIPCKLCEDNDVGEHYEDVCFDALHIRLLLARLLGRPFNSILLELILGGNGGALSDRALCKLAKILQHHDMKCVVDECLTGGRCGPGILLTQSRPEEFQNIVTHITLAKWPSIGMVLENAKHKQHIENVQESSTAGPQRVRGQSTHIVCSEAVKLWKEVEKNISNIPERREAVLKAIRLDKETSWGEGLLMYGPKQRKDAAQGLKNRYLPLLDATKADAIPFVRSKIYEKQCVCQRLQHVILTWVEHYKHIAAEQARDGSGLDGHLCWLLLVELAKPMTAADDGERFFRPEDMLSVVADKSSNVNDDLKPRLDAFLKAAVRKNLIREAQKGKKRRRGYAVVDFCHLNYLSD